MPSSVANLLIPLPSATSPVQQIESQLANNGVTVEFAGQFEDAIEQIPRLWTPPTTTVGSHQAVPPALTQKSQPIGFDPTLEGANAESTDAPGITPSAQPSPTPVLDEIQAPYPRIYVPSTPQLISALPANFSPAELEQITTQRVDLPREELGKLVQTIESGTLTALGAEATELATQKTTDAIPLDESDLDATTRYIAPSIPSLETTILQIAALAVDVPTDISVDTTSVVARIPQPVPLESVDLIDRPQPLPADSVLPQIQDQLRSVASDAPFGDHSRPLAKRLLRKLTDVISGTAPSVTKPAAAPLTASPFGGFRPLQWTGLVQPATQPLSSPLPEPSLDVGNSETSDSPEDTAPIEFAATVQLSTIASQETNTERGVVLDSAVTTTTHQSSETPDPRLSTNTVATTQIQAVAAETAIDLPTPRPPEHGAQLNETNAEPKQVNTTVLATQTAEPAVSGSGITPNATIRISDQIEFAAEVSVLPSEEVRTPGEVTTDVAGRSPEPAQGIPASTTASSPVKEAQTLPFDQVPAEHRIASVANRPLTESGNRRTPPVSVEVPARPVAGVRPPVDAATLERPASTDPGPPSPPVAEPEVEAVPAADQRTGRSTPTTSRSQAAAVTGPRATATQTTAAQPAEARPQTSVSHETADSQSEIELPQPLPPAPLTSEVSANSRVETTSLNAVSTPVTGQIANSVAHELQILRDFNQPVRHLSVKLDPPELGSLRIQIRSQADGLHLQVEAAEDVTLEMLSTRVPEIEQLLKHQDIDISRLSIQRLESDAGNAADGSQDGSRGQEQLADGQSQGQNNTGHRQSPNQQSQSNDGMPSGRRTRTGIRA